MRHRFQLFQFQFRPYLLVLMLIATAFAPQRATSHPIDSVAVGAALHELIELGSISESMHTTIHAMYEQRQKTALANYVHALRIGGSVSPDTANYLDTLLQVNVPAAAAGTSPAPASYTGNGNVTLLGRLNPRAPFTYYGDNTSTGELYQDIWGYAAAGREYALLTHSRGLTIIEVTNPASPVERQFIPGVGGRVNHDVDTYYHPASGKTFAYFGGQQNEHLYSVDLSYLPNTIPSSGIVDLGRTNWAHTVQVTDGLLFVNNAGGTLGCQVFDVQVNPATPPLLPVSWSGSGRDCHDSYARNDILYSADGYSTRFRTSAIGGLRAGNPPVALGETVNKAGMYAHSVALTDDSRYMFAFEEFNIEDINVYDVSNPSSPVNVKTFQWSGEGAGANAIAHNGQIKGNLLYAGYYEAGFRVFDIANPLSPVEVGKYETWRDPDGDGAFNKSITGDYDGVWTIYAYLPSGNVIVSDMLSGLFVFRVDPPQPAKISTTTAITLQTPNPSVTGQQYSVSVSVTPASGSAQPSGSVAVNDGAGATCNATLSGGIGSCMLTANTAGARTLTATYPGDASFNGSSSATVSHGVNKADTSTAITADTPDPSITGQPYTVSFTVSVNAPGAGTPTGSVTVTDAVGGASCTATVAAGSCALTSTTTGAKNLTATYAGNANFNGSSSGTQSHQVNPPGGLPAAPSGLTATKVMGLQGKKTVLIRIDLKFTDNAIDETDFRIERWKTTGAGRNQSCSLETTLTALAKSGTGEVVYSDTGASASTCKYRVAAHNSQGNSAFIEVVP